MTPETLRKFHDGLRPLAMVRCDLNVLAHSLSHVGQDKVASMLRDAAALINESETAIRDALSDASTENLRDAEQASANLFQAVLAGTQIGRTDAATLAELDRAAARPELNDETLAEAGRKVRRSLQDD